MGYLLKVKVALPVTMLSKKKHSIPNKGFVSKLYKDLLKLNERKKKESKKKEAI